MLISQKTKQPYLITIAKHNLTTMDLRVISLILFDFYATTSKTPTNTLNPTATVIRIKHNTLIKNNNYYPVKESLESLRTKAIEIPEGVHHNITTKNFHIISEWRLSHDKCFIDIVLSPPFVAVLQDTKQDYTTYPLAFLFNTQSTYAIRWYQIGYHYLQKGSLELSLKQIKDMFTIEDNQYPKHAVFKRNVIANPLKIINEISSININITKEIKTGRKITDYIFTVKKKDSPTKIPKPQKNIQIQPMTDNKKSSQHEPSESSEKTHIHLSIHLHVHAKNHPKKDKL